MKKNYPKGRSVALIAAIYVLAGVAGALLFNKLTVLAVPPFGLSSGRTYWQQLSSGCSDCSTKTYPYMIPIGVCFRP